MRYLAVVLLVASPVFADDATIVDSSGKEIALKKWSFAAGVVKPAWLGMDALAFRETNSTTFRDGVMTYIPLDRLESLTYDGEKQTVKAKVAGVETPLEGWTRYQGINQLVIAAEVDKGEAGVVELKYHGGSGKGGIKSIKFPGAKAGEAPKGEPIYVVIGDGKKHEAPQTVHNLQALYRADKTEKLLPTLMFKKTFRVDLGQVKKMTVHEQDKSFECEVTLKDGTSESLTLLTSIPFDVHTATLEGLLAAVPAGYKLFPMHTIAEISREAPKADKEKGRQGDKEKK
jgi:hypothetical protein